MKGPHMPPKPPTLFLSIEVGDANDNGKADVVMVARAFGLTIIDTTGSPKDVDATMAFGLVGSLVSTFRRRFGV